METVDIVIKNAQELVTLQGPNRPRIKEEMGSLSLLSPGSLVINEGVIVDIGTTVNYRGKLVLDATGKTVMPGFIDSHTHVVFAGSREFELDMKLNGFTYMDILKKGGGIFYTVEQTRKATHDQLIKESTSRLNTMLAHGTTTCEAKSGYGLDTASERKILTIQKELNETHPIDVLSTFLGAHAVPQEYNAHDYVDLVINEMLPEVAPLAQFCDVFCEKGVFTKEQSRRILLAGKSHGLVPKIHADEIVDTGGAALAAQVDAISADHLLRSSPKGLQEMAAKGIVGVLLPGTPFSLMMKEYADARRMIQLGVPLALATDLNPNCWTENMQFIMQLACLSMKMTPSEALTAATYNAACALGMQKRIGSLEQGKQADVLLLSCSNHQMIPYHFGVNLVDTVIKKGRVVTSRSPPEKNG